MYFEANESYSEVPSWVSSVVRLGYTWNKERSPWKRRVGLISMPCKSACSALISLGTLRKDMEREAANNVRGHYDALCRAAESHLSNPNAPDPILICSQYEKNKKWKFLGKNELSISVVSASYKEKIKKKGKLVSNPNGPVTAYITEGNANQWRHDGDPVVEAIRRGDALSQDDYGNIPGCRGAIILENLRKSYGGVLLVGGGEHKDTSYMKNVYEVGFGDQLERKALGELLTLHTSGDMVKRLDFCNHIHIDKQGKDYYLVIADGAQAFLKSLRYFRNSDVLGVFSRDEPADNLTNVAEKFGELEKYYRPVDDLGEKDISPKIIEFSLMEAR